jgi:hypothetical protein
MLAPNSQGQCSVPTHARTAAPHRGLNAPHNERVDSLPRLVCALLGFALGILLAACNMPRPNIPQLP